MDLVAIGVGLIPAFLLIVAMVLAARQRLRLAMLIGGIGFALVAITTIAGDHLYR